MKTLYLRTPSIVDGSRNTLEPNDIQTAIQQGRLVDLGRIQPKPQTIDPDDLIIDTGRERQFDKLFH